jgi:hypothetical protein
VTPIYYMDTVFGVGFVPAEYVDVTETIDAKVAMLEAHVSQLSWLRDHDGIDVVDQMKTATRYRGMQCGVAYAEGFVPCQTWLRGTTRRLLHQLPRPRGLRARPNDQAIRAHDPSEP